MRALDLGFRALGLGFRALGLGCWALGLGSGVRVWGSGLRAWRFNHISFYHCFTLLSLYPRGAHNLTLCWGVHHREAKYHLPGSWLQSRLEIRRFYPRVLKIMS